MEISYIYTERHSGFWLAVTMLIKWSGSGGREVWGWGRMWSHPPEVNMIRGEEQIPMGATGALSSSVNRLSQGQSTAELTGSHLHSLPGPHLLPNSLLWLWVSQGSLVTMLGRLAQWRKVGSCQWLPSLPAVGCVPVRVSHTPKTLSRAFALQDKRPYFSISQIYHPAPKNL